MTSATASPPTSRLALLAIAAVSLLTLFAFAAPAAPAAPVTADAVLLQTDPSPWEDKFNEEAMGAVFGANWETQTFGAVQADAGPGGLFTPHVGFIWIEGSDESTAEAAKFTATHEAALKQFVAQGGALFINSATNNEVDLVFDGRAIGMDNVDDFTEAAVAVNPSHPIFLGPATPNATSFTGDSFAHGRITGAGLTPLIVGTVNEGLVNDALVLADYVSGAGRVGLGAMTAVEYQGPEDAAKALRINFIHYLLSPVPLPPPPPPAPDTTKPKVKLAGVPKQCVEDGFRFRARISDAGGVGSVRIKLDGKLLRKADGKGKPSRVVKASVPAKKLERPGRHRIKVIARDIAGNVKRQGAGFKVCG